MDCSWGRGGEGDTGWCQARVPSRRAASVVLVAVGASEGRLVDGGPLGGEQCGDLIGEVRAEFAPAVLVAVGAVSNRYRACPMTGKFRSSACFFWTRSRAANSANAVAVAAPMLRTRINVP